MKVLDLQCAHMHIFEGWFNSESDFQTQCGALMIACPLCGDTDISKRLSAPRLNLGSVADAEPNKVHAVVELSDASTQLQGNLLALARHVLANTQDVGEDFSQEARKIHYGEVPERAIRGTATQVQAAELMEEGIAVIPFVLPEVLKKTLQ
jgi:hypothetical protein